jgi:hypothetical protein
LWVRFEDGVYYLCLLWVRLNMVNMIDDFCR